jgi:uncharacterized BrkB/YihY/UPF0761 family membrane protein
MTRAAGNAVAGGERTPVIARRTALAIWSALVAGVVILTVVAAMVGPTVLQQNRDAVEPLTWTALGMALVTLLLSRLLPGKVKAMVGMKPDDVGVKRTIIASALNEGSALLAALAWMLTASMLALAALAISVAGLLLAFPSAARWPSLCGSPAHVERPSRLVR